MSISPVSGLTSTQKAVAATIVTAGVLMVALNAFVLLKGYIPLVGCVDFATSKVFVILGSGIIITTLAGIYGLKKEKKSTPESEEVVKKETEARIAAEKALDKVKELEKIAAKKASAVLKASKGERIVARQESANAEDLLLSAAIELAKAAKAAREAAEERAELSKRPEIIRIAEEAKAAEKTAERKLDAVRARVTAEEEREMQEYTLEIIQKS